MSLRLRFIFLLITHNCGSTCVLYRLASLFEHLAIPNKACARIGGQFEVLRQLQTRCRAGFLAECAKHATRGVEDKLVQHFLFAWLAGDDDLHIHRQDVDAILRTSDRTEVAGDAERVMGFGIHVETRSTMETR